VIPPRRWGRLIAMIYRILYAPPYFLPDHRFMVARYRTAEFGTCLGNVTDPGGSKYFLTVDDARRALPPESRQIPYEREHQFLELWEAAD
jgi:hypothetical protein